MDLTKSIDNKFIVIEGLDGSGKSTATKLLSDHLIAQGTPCTTTFEPTTNPIGTLIRTVLSGVNSIENEALALLFAADRYQHLQAEIIPALRSGHIICDRYYYSNMAYQGICDDSLKRITLYNIAAKNLRKPDIVFFINVSPNECMRRIKKRGEDMSIFEQLPKLTHMYERFISTFEYLKNSENIIFVGSDTASPQDIVSEMITHLTAAL